MAVLSDDFMQNLWKECGRRIQQTRERQHISRDSLAAQIGTEYRNLGEIERGEHGTRIDKLILICKILNMSLDYLFFGVGTHDQDGVDDPRIAQVVTYLQNCSSEQRNDMLDILSKIIKYW